jgi:hypothetical protein
MEGINYFKVVFLHRSMTDYESRSEDISTVKNGVAIYTDQASRLCRKAFSDQ